MGVIGVEPGKEIVSTKHRTGNGTVAMDLVCINAVALGGDVAAATTTIAGSVVTVAGSGGGTVYVTGFGY